MSKVVKKATWRLERSIPESMRNSDRYRAMLSASKKIKGDKEVARLDILIDWMWGTVLPQVQTVADKGGFGKEWRSMCEERTYESAAAAADAAAEAAASLAHAAESEAARYAARYAVYAAESEAAYYAARYAVYAAESAAAAAAADDFWQKVDPIDVLERMIRA